MNPSVLAKVGQMIIGSTDRDEIIKEASKSKAVGGGLRRAAKVVGIGATGGGALVGAHSVGKKSGETSGIEQGKKTQLKTDMDNFKKAIPRIFRAGRVVQARKDQQSFKNFVNRNNPGTIKGNKEYSGMQSGTSQTKTAEIADKVVEGWISGNIKTASIKNLPPEDMSKIAVSLTKKMNQGNVMAGLLWRAMHE